MGAAVQGEAVGGANALGVRVVVSPRGLGGVKDGGEVGISDNGEVGETKAQGDRWGLPLGVLGEVKDGDEVVSDNGQVWAVEGRGDMNSTYGAVVSTQPLTRGPEFEPHCPHFATQGAAAATAAVQGDAAQGVPT